MKGLRRRGWCWGGSPTDSPRSRAWHHLHPAPAVDSQPASPPQQTEATQGPRREERPLGLQEISMARPIDCSAVARETGAGSLRPQCEDFLSAFIGLTCSVKEPPLHTALASPITHWRLSQHSTAQLLVLCIRIIPSWPTSFFRKILRCNCAALPTLKETAGKEWRATEAM